MEWRKFDPDEIIDRDYILVFHTYKGYEQAKYVYKYISIKNEVYWLEIISGAKAKFDYWLPLDVPNNIALYNGTWIKIANKEK